MSDASTSAMEANRPPSTAKWVSRRTLDSQAHHRDSSAGLPQPRGLNADTNNSNNSANLHHSSSAERRKYGPPPDAAGLAVLGRGGGGVAAGQATGSAPPPAAAPPHSSGHGGGGRFGIAGGSSNTSAAGAAAWGGVAPNTVGPSHGKAASSHHHPGLGFGGGNSVNPHGPHGSHHHGSGNGGSRRGHGGGGGGGGFSDSSDSAGVPAGPTAAAPTPSTTMPPPPRSVQMTQGTLPPHSTAPAGPASASVPLPSRDFIPQPRHAKVLSSASSGHSSKPVETSPSPPVPHSPGTTSTAARRWGNNSTPTPRSAASLTSTPGAATGAGATAPAAATHVDVRAGLTTPKPPTAPAPFIAVSGASRGVAASAASVAAAAPPPPPPPPPPPARAATPLSATTAASVGALSGIPSALATASSAGVAPGSAATGAEPSPLDPFHLGENLSFGASVFGGSLHSQPLEIEALLGQVERSAVTGTAGAPGDRTMGCSLRERRSATDWDIEAAIRTVLPGMDEDENTDDVPGPNLLSAGIAAISGSWHTSGDVEPTHPVTQPQPRQPANQNGGGGVGLLADFPTSFAASFAEPTSMLLPSPFAGEAASNTLDNLSRAFSTAARIDSSSFTTSPATASATPLQLPPTSPGTRLPHRATPVEAMTIPASMRDVAGAHGGSPYTAPTPLQPPLPRSTKAESLHRGGAGVGGAGGGGGGNAACGDETMGGSVHGGSSDLFTLYTRSPTVASVPWLASGSADAATPMAGIGRTRDSSLHRAPHMAASRPEGLQALPIKEGSMNSNGGLTATTGSATSPAVAAARNSTTSSHGGSAPNTPSLRKELSTPLSGSRSQPYTPGGSRPQRPSLCAPIVNRQTIAHIFRETPQSLRRKDRMEANHARSEQALYRDVHWPPRNEAEAEQMLRERGATKLLRHLTIISFSRQHVTGVQELFDTWAKNGIPAPDMGFGAYYFYVKEKSEKLLCMKHNGRGASPGHGYGRCDFESRRPYSTCRYEHVCLFCRSKEHGWFEEGKCQGYQQLLAEMEDLGVNDEDVVALLNAMEKPAKTTWSR